MGWRPCCWRRYTETVRREANNIGAEKPILSVKKDNLQNNQKYKQKENLIFKCNQTATKTVRRAAINRAEKPILSVRGKQKIYTETQTNIKRQIQLKQIQRPTSIEHGATPKK